MFKSNTPNITVQQPVSDLSRSLRILLDDVISHGHFGEVDLDHHRSSSPVLNQLYQAVDTDHGVKYSVRPTSAINASIATKRPDTIQIVHPNLLARIDTIEMDCVRFEVYEHVSCELSQWIRQTSGDRLNESVAKMITSQLLSAVDFLHSRYMIHQSIDIHNVLVRHLTQSSVFLVKLMFSTKSGPIRVTRRWRNVSPYASEFVPDLWSIGALVHHLLCGHQTVDVCQSLDFLKISQTVFEFPTHLWHSISSNAIQFICQLVSLKHNRKPNVTARSMQLHSWIKQYDNWLQLKDIESEVGQQWLTHESDNQYWETMRYFN